MFVFALWYLYDEFSKKQTESFASLIQAFLFSKKGSFYIALLFVLQFVNYGIENLKWRISFEALQSISFFQSFKAIYAGNAIAIFTPDRLGTFIGRFSYLDNFSKTKITFTTFVGNYAQLCATFIFSVIGLMLAWNLDFQLAFPKNLGNIRLLIILIPVTTIFVTLFFYQELAIRKFNNSKYDWIRNNIAKLEFISKYTDFRLIGILLLAMSRYMVFVTQFFIASSLFDIGLSFVEIMTFCGILYLFATLIPSPFMGNLGTREAVAVYLLSLTDIATEIVAASLLIWLVNIVFPSLLGGIILLTKKTATNQ